MEKIRKQRNITIDYLKAIACFVVVLQHSLSQLVNKQLVSFSLIKGLYFFSSKINVPLFFIVSGYLLYQQPVRQYMCKKISKIIIPFFTFTALKLAYSFFGGEFAHGDSLLSQLYEAFVVGDLYWFSYAILLMFLIAPLLWKTRTVTFNGKTLKLPLCAIICFVVVILFNTFNGEFSFITLPRVLEIDETLKYFPFFLLGFILRNIYPSFGKSKFGILAVLAVISIPLNCLFFMGKLETFRYFWWITCSTMLCMDIWIMVNPLKKIPQSLGTVSKYTYQVFFLDSFIKVIIFAVIGKVMGSGIYKNLGMCLLIVVVEVLADVIISCIISFVAEKIPVVNILFGLADFKNLFKSKKTDTV